MDTQESPRIDLQIYAPSRQTKGRRKTCDNKKLLRNIFSVKETNGFGRFHMQIKGRDRGEAWRKRDFVLKANKK